MYSQLSKNFCTKTRPCPTSPQTQTKSHRRPVHFQAQEALPHPLLVPTWVAPPQPGQPLSPLPLALRALEGMIFPWADSCLPPSPLCRVCLTVTFPVRLSVMTLFKITLPARPCPQHPFHSAPFPLQRKDDWECGLWGRMPLGEGILGSSVSQIAGPWVVTSTS